MGKRMIVVASKTDRETFHTFTAYDTEAEARAVIASWGDAPDVSAIVTKGHDGWDGWFITVLDDDGTPLGVL